MHPFSRLGRIIGMNNKPMTYKSVLFLFLAVGVFGALGVSVISAHAQAPGPGGGFMNGRGMGGGGRMGMGQGQQMPGVAGKVTAVDVTDNAITVQGMRNSTTSYNVNVSGAVIIKNNATTTISSVSVGDTVMVRGTVSGTSVTATSVRDGAFGPGGLGRPWNGSGAMPTGTFPGGRGFHMPSGTPPYASGTRPMAPPTISGTIASVNGSILTVTGNNGTTYTVDASNATLVKKGSATSSISTINVGDNVQIEGNVSGTAITATAIFDNVAQNSSSGSFPGFIGVIRSFLSNLFHFRF